MSATNDAGKLLLTPKGEYSGSTTYEVMDAVYYITSTVKGVYVAKGTTTGNLPTDATKWKLLIDLGDFITDASLATSSTVGLVKPDGITDEVDALGILTALGVVIKAEVNTGATAYSATWLKVGTTTLTPSTKQMYRVTENSVECLYYWNGTNYAKIPAGHTIVNASGTAMATRGKLKFTGATITDDSTNDQTVVAITGGGADSGMVEDLVKDTVGFTGKNRAYSQTNNAVIASIESGKTYSVSWTDSATITLKKDSASGTEITSGSTSPLTFTADADYDLYFGSSADVTQIMVCDSAFDGEYEDYHDTVETMFEDVADDIDGINLFEPVNVGLISPETVGEGTFIGNSGNTAVVARIEHNTEYIARHEGGNRFRLALSMEKPVVGGACYTVVNDADAKSYTFNSGNYNYVLLHCNNVALSLDTIKPMCYKSVYGANFSYRPYNQQSIQHQINDITGVTGVRNLLKINISTQVVNGITFTVNKDDNGNVLSITANGTATANADIDVFDSSSNPIIGEYIVTGTPETGSANTYYLTCNIPANPAGYRWPKDEGRGVRLTSNDVCTKIRLSILSGQTVSNAVFKPMIRLASDPSDEYVPYAMTNRELTERSNMQLVKTGWNTIFNITCEGGTGGNVLALVVSQIGIGVISFYSNGLQYTSLFVRGSDTITVSNSTTSSITLTMSNTGQLGIIPLTPDITKWTIT